jgi:hypothetical protein
MLETIAVTGWTSALRAGSFERAWRISDLSLRDYCASGAAKHTGERHLQRIWRGEDLAGKRVLVRCYHGLGDTIQFIRLAKPLRAVASEVIVWAQPELIPLLRGAEGVDRLIPLHDGTPDVDIEIMELAHALRVTTDIIQPSAAYVCRPMRPARRDPSAFSVGLVWEAGNWDRRRCVPLELLGRLASETGARLLSLQQ